MVLVNPWIGKFVIQSGFVLWGHWGMRHRSGLTGACRWLYRWCRQWGMFQHSISVHCWQRQWIILLWIFGWQCHWVPQGVYCQPRGRSRGGNQWCLGHSRFRRYLMQERCHHLGLVAVWQRRWFHSACGESVEVWRAESGRTYWGMILCNILWRVFRCVVGSYSEVQHRLTHLLPSKW